MWEVSKYRVISGTYFPVFRLNTGKYKPEITPYLDSFHAVSVILLIFILHFGSFYDLFVRRIFPLFGYFFWKKKKKDITHKKVYYTFINGTLQLFFASINLNNKGSTPTSKISNGNVHLKLFFLLLTIFQYQKKIYWSKYTRKSYQRSSFTFL